MPDFNIHLVNYVREEFGTRFGDAEKNFIRNGVLDLFQRVATQGKARADARPRRGRRRAAAPDNPNYNIIVTWVNTPPASSDHYICYFVRTSQQSIVNPAARQQFRTMRPDDTRQQEEEYMQGLHPQAQGLSIDIGGRCLSEVYIMDILNVRNMCNREHLVMFVFHEFLHNRLEIPTERPGYRGTHFDVHQEDPTGYGTGLSVVHFTGQDDDSATTVDDERFTIRTAEHRDDRLIEGHDVLLTNDVDIDRVYTSMGGPISQYIHVRTPT